MRLVIKRLAPSIQDHRLIETRAQQSRNGLKGCPQIQIITVQPAEDISSCTTKPFVDRRRLASILLRTPETQLSIILLQNLDGSIGAATVQNRIFHIRISLFDHAPNRFFDKLA